MGWYVIIIIVGGVLGWLFLLGAAGWAIGDKYKDDLIIDESIKYNEDVTLVEFGRVYKTNEVATIMAFVKKKFKLNTKQFDTIYTKIRGIVFANADKKLDEIKSIVEASARNDKERSLYAFLYKCAIMDYNRINDETESK